MKKNVIALIISVIFSAGCGAENLLALYEMARENDSLIRSAKANQKAEYEAENIAFSDLLPSLNLGGDYSYTQNNIKSSPTLATGIKKFTSNSASLTLRQPLFRQDRFLALQKSKTEVKKSDSKLKIAEQDLIMRLSRSYFNILSKKDGLLFSEKEERALSRQLQQEKERFSVGLVAITSVLEVQARYDRSKASLILARSKLDNAIEEIREIIKNSDGKIAPLKDNITLVNPTPNTVDHWINLALKNNPEVLVARLNREIAYKDMKIQKSGHLPKIDLVGSVGKTRIEDNKGTDTDTAVIGIELQIPIYSGGKTSSAYRQASFRYDSAKELLEKEERSIRRRVRESFLGVQSSISTVKAFEATEKSAIAALEATEAGFEAGTRSLVDVLNSQRDFFRARKDYAQSKYDYILHTLTLLQSAGVLAKEDIIRVNNWLE